MQVVHDKISIEDLKKMAAKMFGGLVKAVVDIEKKIMVVDAQLHSDQELILLEDGSKQNNLCGINIYPEKMGDEDWIEFDSMINIRPSWGNTGRGVEDPKIQQRIREIVNKLVTR